MAIPDSPYNVNLSTPTEDKVQCTVCGEPNVFGRLCPDCQSEVQELLAVSTEVKTSFLTAALRAVKRNR